MNLIFGMLGYTMASVGAFAAMPFWPAVIFSGVALMLLASLI